ncbi:MAG TPA: precorrin-6y C5,15-methyltransferase (decarboxylating) subunit CbiE [Acidimicrobiales bacterium]|nr:precorrin-6y C5,15-methyltransferase (decarboxylating) subunit CbiE [Acidimicrobiales bacterium]
MDDDRPIAIVGLLGGQWFGRDAEVALRGADVLLGNAEQLALLPAGIGGERVELWGDPGAVLDRAVAERRRGRRAVVLAAGDPGFHGMVGLAARRLGGSGVVIHPAPSSVALAAARLAMPWDSLTVLSVRSEPLGAVVRAVAERSPVAVLVSPRVPPQALGTALVAAGCPPRAVAVCARLAEPAEEVTRTDLRGLARGTFDPLAVVVLRAP